MISVCMATHNGEKYLKDQLDSILYQLNSGDEIIISDDGSSDNTLSIIDSFNDSRIKLIKFLQPENKSVIACRNLLYASRNFENALKHSSGDIIFLCDQDDVWYPDKLKIITELLTEYDIVKHNLSIIDGIGNLIEKDYYNKNIQTNRNWFHLIKYLPFRGCCMAFRRWILEESLPFPNECLQHDSWIGMVARQNKAKFYYCETPLIYHRIHGDNISELTANPIKYKIQYRLILINNLIFKYLNHIK